MIQVIALGALAIFLSACNVGQPVDDPLTLTCSFDQEACDAVPADGASRMEFEVCAGSEQSDQRKSEIKTAVTASAGTFVEPAQASQSAISVEVDLGPARCRTVTLEAPNTTEPLLVTAVAEGHTVSREIALVSARATITSVQANPIELTPGTPVKLVAAVAAESGGLTTGTRVAFTVTEPLSGLAGFQPEIVDVSDGEAESFLVTTGDVRAVAFEASVVYPTAEPAAPEAVTGGLNARPQFELTVASNGGDGQGTVRVSDTAIDCGATCAGRFEAGTVVQVVAVPGADSVFAGWAQGCAGTVPRCNLAIDDDTHVVAIFDPPEFRLTVTLGGSGAGTVTSAPGVIDCGGGGQCVDDHVAGTVVTLNATPSGGSFDKWSGACAGVVPTCTLIMDSAQTVTATFSP